MDLGDTFDHDDIERLFNKQKEPKARLQDPTVTDQMMQEKAAKLDTKTHKVFSTPQKLCKDTFSIIGTTKIANDPTLKNVMAKQSVTNKVVGNRKNLKHMARGEKLQMVTKK